MSMDQYLQGLFILANDTASEVRKLVSFFIVFMYMSFCRVVINNQFTYFWLKIFHFGYLLIYFFWFRYVTYLGIKWFYVFMGFYLLSVDSNTFLA